jgi:hypothetical protein
LKGFLLLVVVEPVRRISGRASQGNAKGSAVRSSSPEA